MCADLDIGLNAMFIQSIKLKELTIFVSLQLFLQVSPHFIVVNGYTCICFPCTCSAIHAAASAGHCEVLEVLLV